MQSDDVQQLWQVEPWWVVVASLLSDEYVSATVDAPTEEHALAEGQRELTQQEGVPVAVEDVARVTGPFPKTVRTEERERRPKACASCGQHRYCGQHPPSPYQTWFVEVDEQSSEERAAMQCVTCRTITRMPAGWPESQHSDNGGEQRAE